jgi:hypothetical protein
MQRIDGGRILVEVGQLWPLCKDNSEHVLKTTRTTFSDFPKTVGPSVLTNRNAVGYKEESVGLTE